MENLLGITKFFPKEIWMSCDYGLSHTFQNFIAFFSLILSSCFMFQYLFSYLGVNYFRPEIIEKAPSAFLSAPL